MMKPFVFYVLCLVIGFGSAIASPSYAAVEEDICIPISLTKQSGAVLDLSLELAVSPARVKHGLMHRDYLAPLGGMLFVFTPPHNVGMWMKNTLIPLDILFVSDDMVIRRIHKNAIPHDLTPLWAGEDVTYVIELKGGAADAHGIQVLDKIAMPAGIFAFE